MKKKLLSLALALALCLGLAVPVSAAGTTKVVVDEARGVKITINGLLRVQTRRYNSNVWYDEFDDRLYGDAYDITIHVLADNSTVTVEALEGRKYADPSFLEALKDYDRSQGYILSDEPGYAEYMAFLDNIEQYAYDSGYLYDWDPEYSCFYDSGSLSWPLEKAAAYTVSPTESEYFTLWIGYDIAWMCESDYAKLTPATLQASGWAQPEVVRAYEAGLMPFSPYIVDCTEGMTRAEFAATTVQLYAAMLGMTYWALDVSTDHPFTDVTWETTLQDELVGMAYNLGFAKGKSGTLFKPNDTLTRQEAAVMLGRVYTKLYGDIPAVSSTSFADDQDVASWAKSEVAFMSGREIIKGVGDNRFAPKKSLTIQEAVIMANRMLEKL